MKKITTLLFIAVIGLITNCSSPKEEVPEVIGSISDSIKVTDPFPALTFSSPVEFKQAGDNSNLLFVVEQSGTIKVFENASSVKTSSTFLDIKSKVASGGELGLLGLAFDPDYKTNGYLYVNYTRNNPLQTVIARYKATSASQADPASELILLTFNQPYSNHNGGSLQFGKDGYLYIATGDGGSGGDPQNNAQNRKSLLGKILRLNVNGNANNPYLIPADNPYAGNADGFREEIYAYGMRNPWRISFDNETGRLFAGDVGQDVREEIDIITKGGNYGWRLKEGVDCYNPSSNCNSSGLTEPVLDYTQVNGDVSITGGYVYRGKSIKSLIGQYIYGDYASGRIWALELENDRKKNNKLLFDTAAKISSFGVDADGEIYFLNYQTGKVMKIGI